MNKKKSYEILQNPTNRDSTSKKILIFADIKQINHYYPFGLNMEGNWNGAQGKNKYQLTGMEWQDDFGLGWSHHQKRFYDPAIGRWWAIDPLSEKYLSYNPYNYVMNTPTRLIDINGMEAKDFIILIAKEGAGGRGHMAAVVQDGNGKYYYVTMGATTNNFVSGGGGMEVKALTAKSHKDAILEAKQDDSNAEYTDYLIFKTSKKTDSHIYKNIRAKQERINSGKENYNVLTNNCTDAVLRPIEEAIGVKLPETATPNNNFDEIKSSYEDIQKRIFMKNEAIFQHLPSGLDNYPKSLPRLLNEQPNIDSDAGRQEKEARGQKKSWHEQLWFEPHK